MQANRVKSEPWFNRPNTEDHSCLTRQVGRFFLRQCYVIMIEAAFTCVQDKCIICFWQPCQQLFEIVTSMSMMTQPFHKITIYLTLVHRKQSK